MATAVALLLLGTVLALTAAFADSYLHRGVESGAVGQSLVQSTRDEPATNVDLSRFPEAERASVAEALRKSGFRYVRQPFSWRSIEQRSGEYDWTNADSVVSEYSRQQLDVIAVAQDAPEWAMSEPGSVNDGSPPVDPAAFSRFIEALTRRYQDTVPFVQLWEAPNDPAHWGGRAVRAEEFLPLLAAGYNAARVGYSAVEVLSPELAQGPTTPGAESDLQFLHRLYGAGGEDYFDIVAIRLDGGQSLPEDRRVSPDRNNLSRAILFRELMIRHGDETTPVWATSFGWAVSEHITLQDQAVLTADGLERAWTEWPWMGLMFHMAFVAEPNTPEAAYAMVDAEGRATPLYLRLTARDMRDQLKIAATGFAPTDSNAVQYEGNWQSQHLGDRTFMTTSQAQSRATVTFSGTELIGIMRFGPESGRVRLMLDGEPLSGGAGADDLALNLSASQTNDLPLTLVSNLDDTTHRLSVTLASNGALTIGGLVVVRETPFQWPVVLLSVSAVIALFLAMRSLLYLVAVRSGQLQGRTGADLWPQLPHLPDWHPSRRL